MGRPKKPKSPFFRFSHDQISKQDGMVPDVVKVNSKLWRELPAKQKKVYFDAFKDEDLVFKNNLAKWEADMAKSGHIHLIRKKTLMESVQKDVSDDMKSKKKWQEVSDLL